MSEIIETLDKKVHIYSLAFSQGFHIEIIGKERKKISLGWCKYRNELQKLWTNHIEEEKMYFQGCKINI